MKHAEGAHGRALEQATHAADHSARTLVALKRMKMGKKQARRQKIAANRAGMKMPAEVKMEALRVKGPKSAAEIAMEKKRGVMPGGD